MKKYKYMKLKEIILLDKKEGQTPLEAIENFKIKNPEYKDISMTYAGRLDPMASGVLIILAGKEIKQKEKYLCLDKKYDFSVLFGFSTDTYDILGKVIKTNANIQKKFITKKDFTKKIKNNLKYFKGKISQEYPVYSSKAVKGKPLFVYARLGKKVALPKKEVFIKQIIFKKVKKISGEKLLSNITRRINRVGGDFRQEQIVKLWKKKLSGKNFSKLFFLAHFTVSCSSGTYVRQIANNLGIRMKIPALAFTIKRTKIILR